MKKYVGLKSLHFLKAYKNVTVEYLEKTAKEELPNALPTNIVDSRKSKYKGLSEYMDE